MNGKNPILMKAKIKKAIFEISIKVNKNLNSIHIYAQVHRCVRTHTHIHTCAQIYVCVCVYLCMYILHAYTQTYIHKGKRVEQYNVVVLFFLYKKLFLST